ncbi:hypothetical protein EVAR_95863_1 [Eumeta japonica]|uniref:Uncharacterized protein n=1 Tax=Eumeta variegata TaxID=151549 RepID=A0A4C1VLG9_EUMVA|nr:hypothetical protein EVAR_95863_1 [Eumeta japonica]
MYSARYWGDLYRYLTPNITIKRISTISELNLTILNVDYAADNGTTTEMSYDYGYGDENEFGDLSAIDDAANYTDRGRAKRDDSGYTLLNETVVLDYFFDYHEESLVNDIIKEREFRRRNAEKEVNIPMEVVKRNFIDITCDVIPMIVLRGGARTSGFFNDFFNRFTAINLKSTDYLPNIKDYAINESAFSVYNTENSDQHVDKIISNSIFSTTNDSNTNETGALASLFKIDLFVPNVNTILLIKNIQNELSDFRTNVPQVDFLEDKEKVDIKTDIPFFIRYDNNTVNIEHDDLTEVVVKTNTVNIKDYDAEERSHSLSDLDEILLNYEDDYSDNSTDYSNIDYVEVFEDRLEPVTYKSDDVGIMANIQDKNYENHSKEFKQEFENFIDYFDNSLYDGEHNSDTDKKKDRSLSRNVSIVKVRFFNNVNNKDDF